MIRIICLALLSIVFTIALPAQLNIILQVPETTPEDADIYIAGNLNNWQPGNENFKLAQSGAREYRISLDIASGRVEFKFTRGSWETVEGDENGNFRPNRVYDYNGDADLNLEVLAWEDIGGSGGGGQNSTANENVQILDEAMPIPQLNRDRRIWVYTPTDYESGNKSYPVLYMHDGQNVFDASTAFAGEWQVDESLKELEEQGLPTAIVVAIDNGRTRRIDEYSPFVNSQYGGGEGDAYLDFIIEELKPRIDSSFRTLTGPENTAIMGSSMGGFISHYAHFRNPEVFGKAGIFSPAYWFSPEIFSHTAEVGKTQDAKLYMLAGARESSIAQVSTQMTNQLLSMGYTDEELFSFIDPDGDHAEWFWAENFKACFLWLFNDQISSSEEIKTEFEDVQLYPNPLKGDTLYIQSGKPVQLSIYSMDGRWVDMGEITGSQAFSLNGYSGSQLIIVRLSRGNSVKTMRIFKN